MSTKMNLSKYIILFTILIHIHICTHQKQIIDVYAISNLQITYGAIIVAAQKLAFEYINNSSLPLLSNYIVNLTLLDSEEDTTIALQHVLDIMSKYQYLHLNNTNIVLPIILGCPYSSLSSITAPALAAMNWAQISSSATSISLSDTSKYPTFYRAIAADSLQSAGIIGLLEYFEWNKFSVVYVNDVYGIYLTIEIMRLASIDTNIEFEVTPIAYTNNDLSSIKFAANQLMKSGEFITVLIVHDSDINPFFTELDKLGRWGYPYFYIGVDVWIDNVVINTRDIAKFSQGYLGTAPWGAGMLTFDDYDYDELRDVYNASYQNYQFFNQLWIDKYAKDPGFLFNIPESSSLSNYGWDTAYTLAHIMQYILDDNDDGNLNNLSFISQDTYNDIITNKIGFIGVSGNVSYQLNGDRDAGLFAYGNILEDGTIQWVGYFSKYYNVTHLNFDSIIWPTDFKEKGLIPSAHVIITNKLETINEYLYYTVIGCALLSMLFAISGIIITLKYHTNPILKAASWRLNIISCIGSIIGYLYIILSGLNESYVSLTLLNIICNILPWLLYIGFTLLFMPLFLKTYRILHIFSAILKKAHLTDTKLLIAIGICVSIDIIILTVLTSIANTQRLYKNGILESIDLLQQTQHKYSICTSPKELINYLFAGILGFYKLIQLLFGIYCCLVVSRIGNKELRKFDETSSELIAIVSTISLLVLTIIIIAFIPSYEIDLFYSISSFVIIIICNICISINLLPRFIAIYTGNEDKYRTTPQQELMTLLEKKLESMFKDKMKTRNDRDIGASTFNKLGSDNYSPQKQSDFYGKHTEPNLLHSMHGAVNKLPKTFAVSNDHMRVTSVESVSTQQQQQCTSVSTGDGHGAPSYTKSRSNYFKNKKKREKEQQKQDISDAINVAMTSTNTYNDDDIVDDGDKDSSDTNLDDLFKTAEDIIYSDVDDDDA